MIPHEPPRVCTTCIRPHIENCPDCWGFGVREDGHPVNAETAFDAEKMRSVASRPCPTCHSTVSGCTPNGIPVDAPNQQLDLVLTRDIELSNGKAIESGAACRILFWVQDAQNVYVAAGVQDERGNQPIVPLDALSMRL